ncbi:hypothetical protein OKW45_003424 [Paraburkholderia sp. WSM4175]
MFGLAAKLSCQLARQLHSPESHCFQSVSVKTRPHGMHPAFAKRDEIWNGAIGFGACHVFTAPAYEIGASPTCHAAAAMRSFNQFRDAQPNNIVHLYEPATGIGFPHIAALLYGEARRKAGLAPFPRLAAACGVVRHSPTVKTRVTGASHRLQRKQMICAPCFFWNLDNGTPMDGRSATDGAGPER